MHLSHFLWFLSPSIVRFVMETIRLLLAGLVVGSWFLSMFGVSSTTKETCRALWVF